MHSLDSTPITLDWLEDEKNGFFMVDGNNFQLHFAPKASKVRRGDDFWNCVLSFSAAGYSYKKETSERLYTLQDLHDWYQTLGINIKL